MSNLTDWVSAKEAISAFGEDPANAQSSAAARSIMRHALEGRVAARAATFVRTTRHGSDSSESADLPADFWSPESGYLTEQDWLTGRFSSGNNKARFREEWVAYGVCFRRDDILALGGSLSQQEHENQADLRVLSGKAGPPLSKHWPEFIAELCVWLYEGGAFEGKTAGKLIAEINDRLARRGVEQMPPSTADATLKAVLQALGKASLDN